jgi:signal transduction histidine kinase
MSRTIRFLAVTASVIGLGALPALLRLIFAGSTPHEFAEDALPGMLYAASIALPCWALLPRLFCDFDESRMRTRMLLALALMAGLAAVGSFATTAILYAAGVHGSGGFWPAYWYALRLCLVITLTFGLIMLIVEVLRDQLTAAREELHRRQIAEERERKIAAEARFASLESRVHPHFLFNTLNSISALVREDPVKAERLIERLASLLRFSLDSEVEGLVRLGEELGIVRDYLGIEQVRFGERLRWRIEASAEAEAWQVPALSVQTLVENSVKYAVGSRREGAEIVVTACVDQGRLRVEVSDDGPGFEPAASLKPGHGLDLLRRRLTTLFGAAATLEVSGQEGRTCIAIDCPETSAAA